METKHTKGEWIIAENHIKDNHYQYTILGEYGRIEVATVIRHNFKEVGKSKFKDENTLHECKEAEANAKLIAAAPELLDVCIRIFEACKACNMEMPSGELDRLDDVITKATK